MNDYLVSADKVCHYAVRCHWCDSRGTMAHTLSEAEALVPLDWKCDAYGHFTCSACQGTAKEQPPPDFWQAQVIFLIDEYQKGLRAPYGRGIIPDPILGRLEGLEAAKRILRGEQP